MGKRGPQPTPLSELLFWEGLWHQVFRGLRGIMPSYEKLARQKKIRQVLRAELAELEKRVPKDIVEEDWVALERGQIERELRPKVLLSERDVWHTLVAAHTAKDVRKACQQSKRWLNPRWQGRPYVKDLYDHAGQFVRAKQDPYYPRRESGDVKRVTFFARAMAGITLGISPSTAVDRLRKLKHGPKCPCVHCDMERWDRMDRTIYKLFFDTEKKSSQKGRKK